MLLQPSTSSPQPLMVDQTDTGTLGSVEDLTMGKHAIVVAFVDFISFDSNLRKTAPLLTLIPL